MDDRSRAKWQRRGAAWWTGVLVFACLPAAVEASPITSYAAVSSGTTTGTVFGPRWQAFLAGGPALWAVEMPPPFPSHIKLATEDGQIVETPFVEYLIWRRDLDPCAVRLLPPEYRADFEQSAADLDSRAADVASVLTIAGAAIAYQRRRARVL